MGLFSWFGDLFDNSVSGIGGDSHSCTPDINPASGLPMVDNTMIDVGGNIYGTDSSHGMDEHHTNLGINPASGLPMMDDSMLDVAGNTFGFDDSHTSSFDDSSTTGSIFDSTSFGDSDW